MNDLRYTDTDMALALGRAKRELEALGQTFREARAWSEKHALMTLMLVPEEGEHERWAVCTTTGTLLAIKVTRRHWMEVAGYRGYGLTTAEPIFCTIAWREWLASVVFPEPEPKPRRLP